MAKRRFWALLAVLLVLVVGMHSRALAQAQAQWTFMVYLDGDNDLEQFAINNFLDMAKVGSDANINIVVQFDRWDNSAKDPRYGNWTKCYRFLVTPGMEPWPEQGEDLGEVNMGNPGTLKDFINWAASTYPANNYALVLWDHGSGWDPGMKELLKALKLATTGAEKKKLLQELHAARRARPAVKWVCEDASHGTMLSLADVKDAINAAGTKVQLVGFDACLMGMVEMAYEIKDTGPGVMVGSEEVIPGNGWPYETILAGLKSNPAWTARDLGSWTVDKYYESYYETNNGGMTQSAIDLTQMNNLAGRITDFASAMRSSWDSDRTLIKTRAQDVMTAIQQAVINERHGIKAFPGAHGLAIYFPIYGFDSQYDSNNLALANNTTWDEFLFDYLDHLGGSWIAVAREQSQYFEEYNNIDLYDFCDKLVKGQLERLRYTCTPAPYNFEDISQEQGAVKLSILDDDNFETFFLSFTLPFDLAFFGRTHDEISISANGALYFVPNKISFASQPIPSLSFSGVNAFIAPFWDDLVPSKGGGVFIMVKGTAPYRRLIVQWENVPHYKENAWTPKGVTFQVIFYENSPDILCQYKDVTFGDPVFDYGASATVGIQRNSFSGTQYSYHSPVLKNESALRFRLYPGGIVPVLQLLLLD